MAQFLTPGFLQAVGSNGSPLAGAKLYVYETSTTTSLDLFSDEALSTPLANPLIADSTGVFPAAFLAETACKLVLTTSADTLVLSREPVYTTGEVGGLAANLVTFDGSGIGFAATNVQDAIEEQAQAAGTPASTTVAGALRIATTANVREATDGNRAMVSEHLKSANAFVPLADASTIAFDWTAGINFDVTLTANRTLGNPTGSIPGQTRSIVLKGNSGTDRTLSFGSNYGGVPPTLADITSTKWYRISIYCISTTHFLVSAQDASAP